MGYLDNTQVIVDAVLTKRGRELLARNDGSFRITQFALADDEINYSLWNEEHPNGSQFAGEAIENGPLLEAFPDENNIMIHKLVSLPRGTTKLPVVTCNIAKVQLSLGATTNLNPTTLNFGGQANLKEPSGYMATIADRRLLQTFVGVGQKGRVSARRPFADSALSETIKGMSFSLTGIASTSLFGSNTKLTTTITVEGIDSGARTTIPIEISKEVIATRGTKGETGIFLK
jgi:hypothetical protein|tara:strand:- start:3991 stop:4683 length:693 start_codon:yes stop_codon:yes gene_type:complete